MTLNRPFETITSERLCPDLQGICQCFQHGEGGEVRQFAGTRVGVAWFIFNMDAEPTKLADDLDVMHVARPLRVDDNADARTVSADPRQAQGCRDIDVSRKTAARLQGCGSRDCAGL